MLKALFISHVVGWSSNVGVVELTELLLNLVPYPAVHCENFCLGSCSLCGVFETQVQAMCDSPCEHGTRLFCMVADGDDIVERLVSEQIHTLWNMARDIDSDFPHHGHGMGIDGGRRLSSC